MYKLVSFVTLLAAANAGLIAAPAVAPWGAAIAPAAVTSQQSNILRSYGNLGQVSTYSKTIDTPYSSVSKSDVRVSNPGYASYAAPALHAPVVAAAHNPWAAPVVAAAHNPWAAPVARVAAAPALLGVAYSAAPAVAHLSFDGLGTHYGW